MQTQWGELDVSDAHVHFFSETFFSTLATQKGCTTEELQPLLGWQIPGDEPAELADRWAVELDRHGISRAALIASIPGDEASVAAAVNRHPDRFYGYFMFNPLLAPYEAHLAATLKGGALQGICLFPAMHGYSLHDSRVMPLYEIASAHPGTVVFVHCGVLTVGVRKKLGLLSHFDMRFSNPIDLHAVALRFPKLNFVIPHFGAGYFREALMLCDLCPNVYLDTSSSNSWVRYEGLDLRNVFERALAICGPGRLLFGTDSSYFPRGWNEKIFGQQATLLADMEIGETDAAQIFGLNLQRLLS